ncbi:MAG: hypothetical protein P0Y48_05080 [Candidatus Microbacterium phytovorans]|uniref:Uncharacterized protein n=1 Tax=Candidatus Microbacterium phytovorans TaxID=3121374 RepID=A0AAJ5W5F5_9MICO|nr:hypothetical protein [Microbacterium sp.]WEK14580.1 MAG: hypothetical protein P0Y48_05080 [Microbacterium sp.]
MIITQGDPATGHIEYTEVVYWVTFWTEESPGQWLSDTVRLSGAGSVSEALEYCVARVATTFVLSVETPQDPHGRLVLQGRDPLAEGQALSF